jgi:hypothetical protein
MPKKASKEVPLYWARRTVEYLETRGGRVTFERLPTTAWRGADEAVQAGLAREDGDDLLITEKGFEFLRQRSGEGSKP